MVCANVTTGGDLKKGVSEQECAEYCWSLPDCKAWSFYRFGSGYCYPYASSDCIERNKGWFWDRVSWGSASCGASKGKSIFIYSLKRQHLKSKYKSETHTHRDIIFTPWALVGAKKQSYIIILKKVVRSMRIHTCVPETMRKLRG